MIDRSEGTGLAVAVAAHAAVFVLLSAAFMSGSRPPIPRNEPIEVSLTEEVGLQSEAPEISREAEAAKLSPVEAPVEPDTAPPEPAVVPDPKPAPKAKPEPVKPAPGPATKPVKPQPSHADDRTRRRPDRTVTPSGNLDGLELGKSNNRNGTATTPPAEKAGPAVVASLAAEVLRQIKPHWRPPSGADSDSLRTTVIVELDRNGTIIGEPRVTQTGITASNSAQAALHKERAVRAVRLAAPFQLPPKFYDAWKRIGPTLYEGL